MGKAKNQYVGEKELMKRLDGMKESQITDGRWVRVRFDDIGHVDAIVVDAVVLENGKLESPQNIRVLMPACDWAEQGVDISQIEAVGNYVSCDNNGL
jgi:hypothetical protein